MADSGVAVARRDDRPERPSLVERLQDVASDILEVAVEIVGSDAASIQVLDYDRRGLRLVDWRGFDPASAAFWGLVVPESASTCGMALAGGDRVVVPDVEKAAALAGSEDLEEYRRSGLRAVQSTPLVADDGRVVGMLSTHWRSPHEVLAEELHAIDLLAQVARARRAELVDVAEKHKIARRQYERGALNRHLALKGEGLARDLREVIGQTGGLTLVCACGRIGCHELIVVPFAAYEQVCESPHRFVVATGHAAEVDEVVAESDGYDVVAIKPEFRDPAPPTADL